ncbi:lecithin retinol acyltransferase family protein [Aeromicrobium sp.]|uniref:lecithin retinol acyltransferase family protein n=1 Tax=Aeromicrobium sp. TaxID=1871063 RepID=UPI003C55DAE9
MARGDHVYVRRGRHYTHHGIDCGDGSVIHYVGSRGSIRHVAKTPYGVFAGDSDVVVRTYDQRLSADETMRNAESRLGTANYHLVRNNCEHFAAWCSTGRAASSQVRRWVLGSQGTVASLVAAGSVSTHLALVGTAGAGLYAIVRPLRRPPRSRQDQSVGQLAGEYA